jgi:hypothetical protein
MAVQWKTRASRQKKLNTIGHGDCRVQFFIKMKNRLISHPTLLGLLLPLILAVSCAPQASPTAFRPPTEAGPTQILPTTTPIPHLFTPVPTPTITATIPGPCTNNLGFTDDITIADNSYVSPGSSIDKQWLVQNSGTCNWDSSYRLKWIGGDPLGAAEEQALYPARAGTQATLRILFTAPTIEGPDESAWQAVDPSGNVFGDLIYIKFVVVIQQ